MRGGATRHVSVRFTPAPVQDPRSTRSSIDEATKGVTETRKPERRGRTVFILASASNKEDGSDVGPYYGPRIARGTMIRAADAARDRREIAGRR